MTILVTYTTFVTEDDDRGVTQHVEITRVHNCACSTIEEHKNCPHVGSSLNPFSCGKYILNCPSSMQITLDPYMLEDEFQTVKKFLRTMTHENIIFQQTTHQLKGLSERVREIRKDKNLLSIHLTEAEWYKLKKFNRTHPTENVFAQKVMVEKIKGMK